MDNAIICFSKMKTSLEAYQTKRRRTETVPGIKRDNEQKKEYSVIEIEAT